CGEDVDAAIDAGKDALLTMPPRHRLRPVYLSNLAMTYTARLDLQKDINGLDPVIDLETDDLDTAIDLLRKAEKITPRGHSYRPGLLANLAKSLTDRLTMTGEAEDFEAALNYANNAIAECPADRAERAQLHHIRANVLLNSAKGISEDIM